MMKLAIALAAILCMGSSHAFQVIPGDQQPDINQLQFANYQDLIPFAARFGESVVAPLLTETQTAIVQHGVNILLDCNALIPETGKPLGGGVQWEVSTFLRDRNGVFSPRSRGYRVKPGFLSRIHTAGDFNRFLNITHTNIVQGAEDADHGVYTCTACTTTGCHSASITLYILGTLFQQVQGAPTDTPVLNRGGIDRTYDVGTDFCVEAGSNETILLRCAVVSSPQANNVVVPNPFRTWTMNGTQVYSTIKNGVSPLGNLNAAFLDNSVLQFFAVRPNAFHPSNDGSLLMKFEAAELKNPSVVPGVSAETVKEEVFKALIGTWSCTVNTDFQTMTSTSVISQC